jgi:hypothetical protein
LVVQTLLITLGIAVMGLLTFIDSRSQHGMAGFGTISTPKPLLVGSEARLESASQVQQLLQLPAHQKRFCTVS